jgi:para-nitrobenzyl esterase
VFRGVPFAQPPVGNLRFRPPVPVKSWPGVRSATKFSPAAIQASETSFAQSEDCLYLNIWAPHGRGPFPVFVWIHGGGFTGGRASDPLFDGTVFTDQGIVCITVPYRLGVLGFLDMEPALGSSYAGSANNGLRDLILALNWIKENVASFGGDSQRVTIGGQSAGAKLTDLLRGIPSATPLFHQMISESGGADRVWPHTKSLEIGETFHQVWRSSGHASAESVLRADIKALRAAQARLVQQCPVHFPLRSEIDGDLMKRPPLSTIREGSTRGKRLLIGTNRDESAFFIGPHPQRDPSDKDLGNLPVQTFRPIQDAYATALPSLDPELRRIRSVTAEEYWLPSMRVLQAHIAGGNQGFLFRMDYPGTDRFANLAIHSTDLRFVWDRLGMDAAPDARRLAHSMHEAWANFIKGKPPSAADLPAWPPFRNDDQMTMIFGDKSHVERRPQATELGLWNGIMTD